MEPEEKGPQSGTDKRNEVRHWRLLLLLRFVTEPVRDKNGRKESRKAQFRQIWSCGQPGLNSFILPFGVRQTGMKLTAWAVQTRIAWVLLSHA